jgi:hypothetical protein
MTTNLTKYELWQQVWDAYESGLLAMLPPIFIRKSGEREIYKIPGQSMQECAQPELTFWKNYTTIARYQVPTSHYLYRNDFCQWVASGEGERPTINPERDDNETWTPSEYLTEREIAERNLGAYVVLPIWERTPENQIGRQHTPPYTRDNEVRRRPDDWVTTRRREEIIIETDEESEEETANEEDEEDGQDQGRDRTEEEEAEINRLQERALRIRARIAVLRRRREGNQQGQQQARGEQAQPVGPPAGQPEGEGRQDNVQRVVAPRPPVDNVLRQLAGEAQRNRERPRARRNVEEEEEEEDDAIIVQPRLTTVAQFRGEGESVEDWIRDVRNAMRFRRGWSRMQKLEAVEERVTSFAKDYLNFYREENGEDSIYTWEDVLEILEETYHNEYEYMDVTAQFAELTCRRNNIRQFVRDCMRLVPQLRQDRSERLVLGEIKEKIVDDYLSSRVYEENHRTIRKLFKFLLSVAAGDEARRRRRALQPLYQPPPRRNMQQQQRRPFFAPPPPPPQQPPQQRPQQYRYPPRQQQDFQMNRQPYNNQFQQQRRPVVCFNCNRVGHIQAACPQLRHQRQLPPRRPPPQQFRQLEEEEEQEEREERNEQIEEELANGVAGVNLN